MHLLKLKPEYITLDAAHRLYNVNVPIVAVTGGIATGKSTVSKKLEHLGATVINADEIVKKIYHTPKAHNFLRTQYPECIQGSTIDFKMLRQAVFSNPSLKQKVEEFIYPKMKDLFLAAIPKQVEFIVYDVPLLFERNLEVLVDTNILVYCPKIVQTQRLVSRDNISVDLAQRILQEQMDIEEKKHKAKLILDNSSSLEQLDLNFQRLIQQVWITA